MQAAIREKLSAGASGKIMTNLMYSAKGEAEYQTAEELAQVRLV